MPHLNLVNPDTAQGELKDLYAAAKQTFGGVPNFIQAMGNSPSLLGAFMSFYARLSKGGIDTATAERIALAMSETNSCAYCVAAHTALAQGAGLSADKLTPPDTAHPRITALLPLCNSRVRYSITKVRSRAAKSNRYVKRATPTLRLPRSLVTSV